MRRAWGLSSKDGTRTNSGQGKTDLFWWTAFGESSYQVIGSDYANYAVIYGCDSWFGFIHTQRSWLLSRTPVISQGSETKSKELMDTKVGDKYDYATKWKNFGTECGFGVQSS